MEVADVRKAQQRLDRLDEALIMATEGQALSWREREQLERMGGEDHSGPQRSTWGCDPPS